MKKNKLFMASLAAALLCQPISVFAEAAPDGKTIASQTSAAQNGAWEKWSQKWESIKDDWTFVSMAPGRNESEMNFAWYSKADQKNEFKYGLKADLSDGQLAKVTQEDIKNGEKEYVSNKVVLKNLQAGKTYYYQVSGKDIQKFTTDNDTSDFSFILVGDPQIGSSNEEKAKKPEDIAKDTFKTAQSESVKNDAFNWNYTLNRALNKTNGKASFILSTGDQIQTNAKKVKNYTISEIEYTGFLSSNVLNSVPFASTVGNHDADNANYLGHFNIANLSDLGSNDIVGGDYYYTYGDALFIQLNTQDTSVAEHKEFIEKTVAEHKDAKWKIVTLHQDIYGSAEHSNEPEITNLRYELIPVLEANDIDLVLTGHDHAYSRSKLLLGGKKTYQYTDDEFDEQLDKDLDAGEDPKTLTVAPANIKEDTTDEAERSYLNYLNSIMDKDAVETIGENGVAINPKGILYLTAGSSSGSKHYDLVPRVQSYIANRWQEDVPTYSIIDVNETTLTMNTYRSDTDEKIDTEFTLVKTADKSQLEALIEKAKTVKKELYTKESYEILTQALAGAQKIASQPKATTEQITNAHTALQQAMNKLVKIQDNNQTTVDDNSKNDENKTTNSSQPVKTGDTQSIVLPLSLISVSVIGAFVLYRKKKI